MTTETPTVELAPEAERDLDLHLTWLAERNPYAATELNAILFRTLDLLAEGGIDGPVAVLPSGERVRRFYAHPFHVYYQRKPPRKLFVLRLYHHARDPIT